MSETRLRRLVLDLYPSTGSEWFREHSSAVAVCWSSEPDELEAFRLATTQLTSEGWTVVGIVESMLLAKPYPEEQHVFSRAVEAGLNCTVDLMQRLSAGADADARLQASFLEFCRALEQQRAAVVLYSEDDHSYGRTLIGDQDGFPVWRTIEHAQAWAKDWDPGYLPTTEPLFPELHRHLQRLQDETLLVALCLDGVRLTMFHPAALWDAIRAPDWPRLDTPRG